MAKAARRTAKKPKTSLFEEPPRRHVLLLTCMDQRLLDDTVAFMNGMNLENRYDHLILAGSAMGARLLGSEVKPSGVTLPWKQVFFDHLAAAINLLKRQIKDIFLLEHLDCGAYMQLHPDEKVREKYTNATSAEMVALHIPEVTKFAKEVEKFCAEQEKNYQGDTQPNPWTEIRVHCLLMDLMGNVEEILAMGGR